MPLEVILRVPGCVPANEVADFVVAAEEAGFAGVGITDTQLLLRDAYISMALAAQRTSTIRLYTAVTNPVTRHVSVLASLIQTVEEVAPGRVRIILGTGFSAVATIGRPAATLARMASTVTTLRTLLSGGEVEFGSFKAHLGFPSSRHIPIMIAARGPRTLEMAAEVADGILMAVGRHPATIAFAQEHIAAGCARTGRDPADLDLIHEIMGIVGDTKEDARSRARQMCAGWMVDPYQSTLLALAGLKIGDVVPAGLRDLYPDVIHAEDVETARRLVASIPADIVDQVSDVIGAIGTPEYIADTLATAALQGTNQIYIRGEETHSLPQATLAAFRDVIFPRLRNLAITT